MRSMDMDSIQYRRFKLTLRHKLRRWRASYRLNSRRNTILVLVAFFTLLNLCSRAGQHYNSTEQRWRHLQSFAKPGILGAPSDIHLNKEEDVKIQLCSADGQLCSGWGQDRLWESAELNNDESWLNPGWIKVPIGVQAVLVMKDGRRQILSYGTHRCGTHGFHCQEIGGLIVEESILSAIDRIAEACSGDNWKQEPAIVHTIRPRKRFSKRDVTMLAQFSISRLEVFERAASAWAGPMSVVIYLPNEKDVIELQKYFEKSGKLAMYDSITLTIVKPEYGTGEHKRYPINHLRNIGIQTAATDYIFLIDADFVPTTKLYTFAKSTVISLLEHATMPTAYVVPCVAIQVDFAGTYPDTIQELQPLMKSGVAYITDPNAGHGPTSTRLFMNPHVFGSSPAYEVCYESQWEPYYIVNRNAPHPFYDERFKDQGGDKQSHALMMNAIGYRFLVLRDHFMYHMDHPKLKWVDQKKKDFTYFENYSPQMEKIFGRGLRWPRGCSHPLVSSSKQDLLGIGAM